VSDLRKRRERGPALLRRVLGHPQVLPLTALLLRARTVEESTAFAARELLGRGGAFAYTVRGGAPRVVVRHGTGDPATLGEVFHERDYEPPSEMPAIAPRRIVDLGANVGYFGAFALTRWPGSAVIAFEPDPANAAVHERTIELNGLGDRWELRRAAALARPGDVRFKASGDALAHASSSGDLVVPGEDVIPLLAGADLVKVDIEGGEWELLGDPRFAAAPPRRIVLEHHPDPLGGSDPRATALRHLRAAGLVETASIFARSDGYGMLWAWQP
jgi:FkbM family methyltransferase